MAASRMCWRRAWLWLSQRSCRPSVLPAMASAYPRCRAGAADSPGRPGEIWHLSGGCVTRQVAGLARRSRRAQPGVEVVEQRRDRLLGAGLVGADEPGRAALGPADDVHAGPDPAPVVRRAATTRGRSRRRPGRRRSCCRRPGVRRSPGRCRGPRPRERGSGARSGAGPVAAPGGPARRAAAPVLPRRPARAPSSSTSTSRSPASPISSGVVKAAALGSPAAEHHDLRGPDPGAGEQPSQVQGDVAGADHHSAAPGHAVERQLEVAQLRVTVGPGREGGAAQDAGQVRAGDVEPSVGAGPGGVAPRRRTPRPARRGPRPGPPRRPAGSGSRAGAPSPRTAAPPLVSAGGPARRRTGPGRAARRAGRRRRRSPRGA